MTRRQRPWPLGPAVEERGPPLAIGVPARAQTDAQRRTNAAWLRDQMVEIDRHLEGHPQRWPIGRVLAAHRAILAGDEHWLLRAADALA